MRPLAHANGHELRVRACAIDSGGAHAHEVYQFCRAHRALGVFAVKGHSQRRKPIIGKPSTVDINRQGKVIKGGAQLWLVGTDTAKDLILGRLRLKAPGPGYVHFSDELADEYYEQLTVEKRVARNIKGRTVYEWTKPAGARNEALDLEVYAMAAAHKLCVNRWKPRRWEQEAARLAPKTKIPDEIEPEVAAAVQQQRAKPVAPRRGGFVTRWRQ